VGGIFDTVLPAGRGLEKMTEAHDELEAALEDPVWGLPGH